MRRRTLHSRLWLILPAILGAAFISACVWGTVQTAKAKEYHTAVKSVYAGAYTGLLSELSNLEVSLSKLQIVGTKPQYVLILDDVWHSCGTCSGYLAQIPASHADTKEMSSFIARVGDYARTLSTSLLHGKSMTGDDMKQIEEMRKACTELTNRVAAHYSNGDYPDDIMKGDGYFETAKYVTDESRQDYPTLIYDGPFSESAEKAKPKGLTGKDASEKEAHAAALMYVKDPCTIESCEFSNGDIPMYSFSGYFKDGRDIDIAVTKKGASLLWYMTSPEGDEGGVPDESVTKKYKRAAEKYLYEVGYPSMTSTYAQYYNGSVVINFAYEQDDVVIYNDLVKVWVDRKTQKVIGCDARNYIYSHHKRSIDEPEITENEASMLISENLKVEQTRLALIPLSPEKEVLCYEFKGKFGEDAYIVYVNAQTGEEEQIFRIINTDEGQLVV